jgi:hypothetical protein
MLLSAHPLAQSNYGDNTRIMGKWCARLTKYSLTNHSYPQPVLICRSEHLRHMRIHRSGLLLHPLRVPSTPQPNIHKRCIHHKCSVECAKIHTPSPRSEDQVKFTRSLLKALFTNFSEVYLHLHQDYPSIPTHTHAKHSMKSHIYQVYRIARSSAKYKGYAGSAHCNRM